MPRGQTPAQNMEARYHSFDKQLSKAKYDEGLLRKLRRKLNELGGKKSPNAGVTTERHRSLLKKLNKIESNMLLQDRMKDKVKEATTP